MPKQTKKPRSPSRPNRRDRARYRQFAEAYLAVGQPTYFNATKSAEAAGYAPGTVKGHAHELVGKSGIQAEMRRLRDERAQMSTIVSPVEALELLSAQARTLPDVFVDESGAIVPLKCGEKDRAAAVAGIKETRRTIASGEDVITETKMEYKLIDRTKALELICKHHGLFEKDNEQQKPEAPVQLVAMPSGDLTLAEWTSQVLELQAKKTEQSLHKAAG